MTVSHTYTVLVCRVYAVLLFTYTMRKRCSRLGVVITLTIKQRIQL
jgi:hypothetical protein